MIGETTISKEVEDFILNRFGFKRLYPSADELDSNELMFISGDFDHYILKEVLDDNFKYLNFHTTSMGGVIAVLVKRNVNYS